MADRAVEGEEEVRYEEDIAERDRALLSSALTRPKDGRAPPSVDNDAEPGAGGRRVTQLLLIACNFSTFYFYIYSIFLKF